jgi:aminopeptidase N
MKHFLFAALLLCAGTVPAQEHPCAKHKQAAMAGSIARSNHSNKSAAASAISHDNAYDVKFVHLDLQIERTNKYIVGGVNTVATVTVAVMDTFMTILHSNHAIDSVRFNGTLVTVLRQDSMVKVKTPSTLNSGASFTAMVYYKGTAPSGGSAIGSGFSNATSPSWSVQATWSLSESFVAYHWWPCKQSLTDKIDSSWVFITTDSTNKAGSNGVLTNVVNVGSKKRYEWKSRTPIDYYLVSVAVSKYKEYDLYAKPLYLGGDSILIQNYIYDVPNPPWHWPGQKADLDKLPQQMNFLCNMYGMYPFYKEKYGHCMAPLGGGMEHQTMTTLGSFDYYINAHELGHQWWGNNVTCKTWCDIWINEGFASYTEHLVAQYLDFPSFQSNMTGVHNDVMSALGGSVRVPAQDSMNTPRIFSGRLTYNKGGAIIHTLRFLTNNDSLWFNTLRGFQNQYKNGTATADDFKNYYSTFTGINANQFFSQWYYGEGYPTFNVKYNHLMNTFFLRSTQSVSMPGVTPLFITPMEYSIKRAGKIDTVIRVMHSQATENYSFALSGTVIAVVCDPNNWVINQVVGPAKDQGLGIELLAGMPEDPYPAMSIGPNPAEQEVILLDPLGAGGTAVLTTIDGRVLAEFNVAARTAVPLNGLSPGVYLLIVKDGAGDTRKVEKIVKAK